jgi:Mg2+ and Co2+ transporter CorA
VPITDTRNDVETFDTIPLGVILAGGCVVTVCSEEAPVLGILARSGMRGLDTTRPINFLYQILYQNALTIQSLNGILNLLCRSRQSLHATTCIQRYRLMKLRIIQHHAITARMENHLIFCLKCLAHIFSVLFTL